ncbi:hypothetical protein [Paenibacillus sp.]|uniref:hypothetical protein n=1 Tax=Paenibacillus sp. TaxID=58172 RepID=UPI002D4242A8|nr:hypothetical protein [Paenibacillus sp.]HZG55318.1 hypothetical protein [Paenibacillus sp.]
MPTSEFKMTTVAQRIYELSTSYDNFQFITEGDWIVNPNYEFTDAIALAWSDEFTVYDDYSYIISGNWYDYSRTSLNAVVPEGGVGYDVDLQVGTDDDAVFLVATVYKNATTGTANVVGEYGHVEIMASSIGLGFSSTPPSVSMSVGFQSNLEKASPAYDDFAY